MEVRMQAEGIEEVRLRLGDMEHKAPNVLANAINRTVVNIKKNMAKQTASRYNIASTEVKKTIHTTKATKSRLEGASISRASPIALAKFKVSPNSPVSYRTGRPSPGVYRASVEKGKGQKPLDGQPKSFVAVMKNGHKGVFVRTGKGNGLTRSERRTGVYNSKSRASRHSSHDEPIKQNFGPSVPQMIGNREIMKTIQDEAQSTLRKRIDAEVANILRKGAGL